jgi:iron(III) transport system permease protein
MARVIPFPAVSAPRPSLATLLLLVLFLIVAFMTIYPTILILINSFQTSRPGEPVTWGLEGWRAAFSDPSIPKSLGNTFILAIVRVAIATTLAVFFSWVVTRTDTPGKHWIEFLLWLGFFFPQLPMVMGWILLLDPQYGLINSGIKQVFGFESPFNIYGYGGIIWAHLTFSTSLRFLLITPAFRAMDAALEEAAKTSGSGTASTVWRITVPILAPAILAAVALGTIKALESFEIEMILGIPVGIYVYSTEIWDYIHWEPPQYGPATALSSFFLLAIFALVWLQRVILGRRGYTTITGRGYSVRPGSLGRWRWATAAFCWLWIVVMIGLPLSMLVMGTFMRLFGFFHLENPWTMNHWASAFDDPVFVRSLRNTLILGVGAAVIGALFCALVSYVLIRTRFFARGLMDFFSWLPWALPGVLLGLSLLWVFVGNPVFRPVYGTLYVLILAMIIAELPLGTQVLKASVMQVSKELEESAWMSGAPWLYTVRRILLPILMPAILAVGLIIFIAAVRNIPTIVFLSSVESRTLSLLMLDYMAGAQFEKATVMGVFITFLILVAALLGRMLGLRVTPGAGH